MAEPTQRLMELAEELERRGFDTWFKTGRGDIAVLVIESKRVPDPDAELLAEPEVDDTDHHVPYGVDVADLGPGPIHPVNVQWMDANGQQREVTADITAAQLADLIVGRQPGAEESPTQ